MKYGIKLVATLLVLTFASHIRAQDEVDSDAPAEEEGFTALVISGQITDEKDKTVKAVNVELFEGNEVVSAFYTKKNGKFKFQLLDGHHYTIQLTKSGYVSKRISVNTNLPAEDDNTYYFDFDIGLVPEEGNKVKDETLYEYPSAIIGFDDRRTDFYFDEKYTRSLMKDIRTSTVN